MKFSKKYLVQFIKRLNSSLLQGKDNSAPVGISETTHMTKRI